MAGTRSVARSLGEVRQSDVVGSTGVLLEWMSLGCHFTCKCHLKWVQREFSVTSCWKFLSSTISSEEDFLNPSFFMSDFYWLKTPPAPTIAPGGRSAVSQLNGSRPCPWKNENLHYTCLSNLLNISRKVYIRFAGQEIEYNVESIKIFLT